jgi:hypothetical protein
MNLKWQTNIQQNPQAVVARSSIGASILAAKKWGGWGYERSRGETDWFCYEHRPEKAMPPRHVAMASVNFNQC